jgi:hypothetical protein
MANIGDQLLAPEAGWSRFDNDNIKIEYTGAWSNSVSTKYWNGSRKQSTSIGSSFSFKFYGTRLRIIAESNINRSNDIELNIDGNIETISMYSDVKVTQALIYESSILIEGSHTVEVTLNGSGYIVFDAIDIDDTGYLFSSIVKHLLKDETSNEIYTINSGSIVSIGNGALTEDMFINNGKDNVSEFVQAIFDQLVNSNVGIYNYTTEEGVTNKNITIEYIPEPQLILPTGNIDISSVENIDSIALTANNTGSSDLKIIISIDEGVTYKTFNGSIWETVDHTNLTDVKSNGMTITELNALSSVQIMSLIGTSNKIRFGYYMEITDPSETCETDELSITFDMNGEWKKATHKTDYHYKYLNNTTLQIELFSNGDFKINY